ncbi:MAG: hypothetical protein HS111_14975 [Kofleriaceae bacterium]|nr:hypothetical protein [Kofleriaceae bacterium]
MLGRFCHGIVFRTFGDDRLQTMATHAGVPVINALTGPRAPVPDPGRPPDRARAPGTVDVRYAWIGDAANVAVSWRGRSPPPPSA